MFDFLDRGHKFFRREHVAKLQARASVARISQSR